MQPPEQLPDQAKDLSEREKLRHQITIVLPALNEEESIGRLIDEIKTARYDKILVVDGYSKDQTVKVAEEHGALVLMQHGHGKAGALVTAFHAVASPFIVVLDADGSYDPNDLDKFLPLLNDYDFVKGERVKSGNMSSLHKFGNGVITRTFNLLFGTTIGDICSGIYLLRREKVTALTFEKHPLTIEQELAAQMVLSSSRITSVPVNYRKRFGGKSKTHTWRQSLRDLATNFDLART
jgi:dolichol-phosphate mannosyltransferase